MQGPASATHDPVGVASGAPDGEPPLSVGVALTVPVGVINVPAGQ